MDDIIIFDEWDFDRAIEVKPKIILNKFSIVWFDQTELKPNTLKDKE